MDIEPNGNGSRPKNGAYHGNGSQHGEGSRRLANPYLDAPSGETPREIVDFELDTYPYANMLPGISNVRAARTIGQGVDEGRKGNRGIMLVSAFLLVVFIAPLLLAILEH